MADLCTYSHAHTKSHIKTHFRHIHSSIETPHDVRDGDKQEGFNMMMIELYAHISLHTNERKVMCMYLNTPELLVNNNCEKFYVTSILHELHPG